MNVILAHRVLQCQRCGDATTMPANDLRAPRGWFLLAAGDWRCGCVLKIKPTCDAEPAS